MTHGRVSVCGERGGPQAQSVPYLLQKRMTTVDLLQRGQIQAHYLRLNVSTMDHGVRRSLAFLCYTPRVETL